MAEDLIDLIKIVRIEDAADESVRYGVVFWESNVERDIEYFPTYNRALTRVLRYFVSTLDLDGRLE